MRILITCTHYPVASGRYMADAFRRLGHVVRTQGGAEDNRIWGMTVDPKYIWTPNNEHTHEWADLIIVMDSDPHVWGMTKHLVNTVPYSCPVVVYGVDNHVRSYEDELFTHYFLAHYHGTVYPVDPTRKDHTWLPCATDTKLFTPSPVAWADREHDICMIGVMYPKRVEVINAMKDAGLKVFAATGLLYDEYRAAYHNSRISLCVSAAGDVAQRIFETGGMGCAILTDPLLDFGDEMTNRALHLFGRATYTNPKEAVNLAHELLEHQAQAFQINSMMSNDGVLGEHAAREMQKNCQPHTWDARAQVIINWFEREYGKVENVTAERITGTFVVPEVVLREDVYANEKPKPTRKPFLNLGCGRVILPGERPAHHHAIPENIYQDEQWVNIDRVGTVGADMVFDLFTYPWPLESNSYDGAILTHIAEHIPHEIKFAGNPDGYRNMGLDTKESWDDRWYKLVKLQDGFFAFFSELARVLTPGAEVHLISPHGMCSDAFVDPTHTRQLFPHTFQYFVPNPDAPFEYSVGSQWEIVQQSYGFSEHAQRIMTNPLLTESQRNADLQIAMETQWNIIREFYMRLKVIK